MISALVYRSRASRRFSLDDIQALARESCHHNEQRDISGVLLFDGGHFLQVLEGPEAVVQDLYARLQRDPRHSDLTVLLYAVMPGRSFARWGMHLIGIGPAEAPMIPEGLLKPMDERLRRCLEDFCSGSWQATPATPLDPSPGASVPELQDAAAGGDGGPPEPDRRATILIVDDSPELLLWLSNLLQGSYRVKAAKSGEKALQLAMTEPLPDLILLDVMMPGVSGEEVLIAHAFGGDDDEPKPGSGSPRGGTSQPDEE